MQHSPFGKYQHTSSTDWSYEVDPTKREMSVHYLQNGIYHTTQLYNRVLVRIIHTVQVAEYTTIKLSNVFSDIIGGPGEEALISDSNAGDNYRNLNLAGIKLIIASPANCRLSGRVHSH